jgi:methyl-accepting chemotaxis protein
MYFPKLTITAVQIHLFAKLVNQITCKKNGKLLLRTIARRTITRSGRKKGPLMFRKLPLSYQIVGGVAAVLIAIGAGNLAYEYFQQKAAIIKSAEDRGNAALDMLESVHVSAMLSRDKVADGDPAVETLDGTMERFSEQSKSVTLWLAMGPKIVDFQKAQGQNEVEGPRDTIDEKTISDKAGQVVVADDKVRITRAVVLGHGTASNEACAACHTSKMNIQKGEVLGAYSAQVDMAPEQAAFAADMRNKGLASLLVFVLALSILTVILRVTAINPMRRLARATEALAEGNIDVETGADERSDEIGAMARALDVFRAAFIRNRKLEDEAVEARRKSEEDRRLAQEQADREAGERLRVATAGLAEGLSRLASGDLAFQLDTAFAPDFEALRHDFNSSIHQLGQTLSTISSSARVIDDGTREIASNIDDLARRTEQQAASLEETAAAVDQITGNTTSAQSITEEVRQSASDANQDAVKSAAVVSEAEVAMQRIEESSGKISSIIGVIDEIAFQTNLLALNAGVEAARAGDAGKGFAVVAQEVRELAQRSASAAKEIKALIHNSSVEVGNGVRLVRETGDALKAIGAHVSTMSQKMEAIAMSTKDQALGLSEVNKAVSSMDQMTQQNAAMVEESNAAGSVLASEAGKLREMIANFRLDVATGDSVQALRRTAAVMSAKPAVAAPARPAPAPVRAAKPRAAQAAPAAAANWEEF